MLLAEFDVEKYERSLKSEGFDEGIEQGLEQGLGIMIESLQEIGQTKEDIADIIARKYALAEIEAERKVEMYWK